MKLKTETINAEKMSLGLFKWNLGGRLTSSSRSNPVTWSLPFCSSLFEFSSFSSICPMFYSVLFPYFTLYNACFFFPMPLFSCASRNLQKYLVFLQPSLFDHHCTWWILLRRWTPFPHSGREPPLQCTATLWHWKGGSLAHWGSTGRGLHCHKPSWPNPLERHRRAASPIHFLIGDSERERILSWQKTNHVLSCVKS